MIRTERMTRSQSAEATTLSTPSDLVHTAGGNVHYVKKQVAYGLHGVIEEDLSPPKASEAFVKNEPTRRSSKKKNPRSKSEGNLALCASANRTSLVQSLPAHGDLRHVYLDMTWTRFGFRLQSYGRRSEEIKTVVQTVTAGSPAFMAGLHPGDCILEVNGTDVSTSSTTEIVSAIMDTKKKRVQLLVKYVNGAHYLELKKKLQVAYDMLKEKQKYLRELLAANNCPTSFPLLALKSSDQNKSLPFQYLLDALHSTTTITTTTLLTSPLNNESASLLSTKCHGQLTNGHLPVCYENNHIISQIAIYTNEIQHISCDAIVLPFDSIKQSKEEQENDEVSYNRLVSRFLQMGGDKLINELSLAKQCNLGEVMTTSGGELKSVKHLFHCVIGHFEEHIRSCTLMALEKCLSKEADTIAFWLDGFISCNVPPTLFLETVKRTLEEKSELLRSFKAIIFASQSMPNFPELVMDIFKP